MTFDDWEPTVVGIYGRDAIVYERELIFGRYLVGESKTLRRLVTEGQWKREYEEKIAVIEAAQDLIAPELMVCGECERIEADCDCNRCRQCGLCWEGCRCDEDR